MAKKNAKLSLASQGLRYKLTVAAALMSVLPLLICGYLALNYILPGVGFKPDVTLSIIISVFIAGAGFYLVKEVFDRILSVSSEAKLIAAGDVSRKLSVKTEDEVGDLSQSLNMLTDRIRANMDELKNYSEKTSEINFEIQKWVLVLSSLLQISSLISQGARLEDILKLTTEKCRLLANSEISYLLLRMEGEEEFCMKSAEGANLERLMSIRLEPKEVILRRTINSGKPLMMDKQNIVSPEQAQWFSDRFGVRNTVALPIIVRGRIAAILGVGNNRQGFLYPKEEVALIEIFAKQVAIAVENDILMHRIEKLEIKDSLTGLYNEAFMRNRLQEEIKRAITYQRPCALIIFDIDNFRTYESSFGLLRGETALKKVASLIRDSVTEIDRVGRIGDDTFAVILPEKNKRRAADIADDIRKKIEFGFQEEEDINKRLTVSAGVSENPLDGVESAELFVKAKEYMALAKQQGKNRVVSTRG